MQFFGFVAFFALVMAAFSWVMSRGEPPPKVKHLERFHYEWHIARVMIRPFLYVGLAALAMVGVLSTA